MAKAYEPASVESKWYPHWESQGYFHGKGDSDKSPYTIVIPPPNVTGMLTLGHVLNNTLQDILIRWEKLRGRDVCWVPGTDHAGIATQSKVEAHLRVSESLSRYDLGRDKFLVRVWEWKEKYGGTIIHQLRRLGVACDWRRERFTLDDDLSDAVVEVFLRLYDKGLIYRGKRMINWCPKSHTALSDEEVIYQSTRGSLWYMRYPLTSGDGHIIVATTRPETMLGDTGVAVHPEDERYRTMIGQTVTLPLTGREIPIFGDTYVDREFGTGAVKVTPAHDPNDYDMSQRHNLAVIEVIDRDGSMTREAGPDYQGLDRYECRRTVVAALQEQGVIEKIEDYEHQVGFSERGHVPVEPRLSEQWFVKMTSLAKPAIKAVEDGRIRFYPERWTKTYNHWMENIKDWCISRQLWWGHRIPAYYCTNCNAVVAARSAPEVCTDCGHNAFRQDEDVLDTWFSSWLWPFSVFGWPKASEDLKHFYPTQSLVTGPDIIFFWVARMIMAGLEFMDDIPFSDVYFTSIIRDDKGRKLSKSLNNSPNPLDVIDSYGADALRYTVIYIAPVGLDIRYSNEKCEIGRNFANKIWNAARFRLIQGDISENWDQIDDIDAERLRPDDRWVLYRTNTVAAEITASLTAFDFHSYAIQLYEFIWNEFCDWYVESAKAAFYGDDEQRRQVTLRVFDYVLSVILRLLHPVMPFVTEEIFHGLNFVGDDASIMNATWPEPLTPATLQALRIDADTAAMVKEKFDLIKAGRNLRGDYNIPFNRKIAYVIKPTSDAFRKVLEADPASVTLHLNAESIIIDADYMPETSLPSAVGNHGLIYMPLEGAVDVDAEVARLKKQHEDLQRVIGTINKKLENENFLKRAPQEIVSGERERQKEYSEKIKQVEALLAGLQ